LVLVALLKKPIQKLPWLFYLICVAIDVFYIAMLYTRAIPPQYDPIIYLVQKAGIAVSLFFIVMFVGVFAHDSKVRNYLEPIRGYLSIMACILILGHIYTNAVTYLPRVFSSLGIVDNVAGGLIVALFLFILVLILGVTSFQLVRKHMSGKAWKALQRFAYLFYALICLHVGFMLLPGALKGQDVLTAVVFAAVFVVYLVARLARFALDRRSKA
jgi:DMSO/TMAO reductase YedYZ heme-binding membrane subunit